MASASQPKRTSIIEIANAIKQCLVDEDVQVSNRIKFVARGAGVPKFQGESDILIRIGGFTSVGETVAAAGRVCTMLDRLIHVICRSRLALDQADRDDTWLLNSSRGHFVIEEQVLDALHIFWPTDSSDNDLTTQPIRVNTSSQADKEASAGLRNRHWGYSAISYDVQYLPPLNQDDQ